MSTQTTKCPNCGGPLHFDPEKQLNTCEYCLSEFTNQELVDYSKRQAEAGLEDPSPEISEPHDHVHNEDAGAHGEEDRMIEYTCNSCGAHVVTEDTTSATFCYYCHNPVIITERLSGEFRPDKVIPFHFSREKAVQTFLNWVKRYKYVPKSFYSDSQLAKMTGLYVPNWMAKVDADIQYDGVGTRIRVWRVGDIEYTEFKEYGISRSGKIKLDNLTEIGMRKIDHGLLNSIGPYDETKAVDFNANYLNGFFSEKYDIEKEDVRPLMLERSKKYSDSLVRNSVTAYDKIKFSKSNVQPQVKSLEYVLLPVWILTYQYNQKTYIYAVNGQTGKTYGEIPLDSKRLGATSLMIAAALLVLLLLGGALIW
ncbi:MAG: hypothetical protein Q4G61_07770 [Tissierellia bacterium]|nr:hypothetical protein [Tissierellia bacterium]